MPHCHGYRRDTRDQMTRPYRRNGLPGLATYMHNFKRGDYVDIVNNSAVHKGMAFKHYHGRTGVVFNVTKSGVGVTVNKIVREKQLKKRVLVNVAHVRHATCFEEIIRRKKENEAAKKAARNGGKSVCLKRQPKPPPLGYVWTPTSITTMVRQQNNNYMRSIL
jgi:large subunit ribosomal protein L21e